MTPEKRKIWLQQEEARLINYQHQHRGISFIKLLLPPTTDREVNLVGLDNHIYKGRIPRVPEDQLPPDVDEATIDEEALYKEIRDMNFPPVPPREPLGPSRRIGGQYTIAKKLSLVPVRVDYAEKLEETLVLGRDGRIYKGTERHTSVVEPNKQLRVAKRSIQKVKQQRSSRGYVEPSIVTVQTDRTSIPYGRKQPLLIDLPGTNVWKFTELIKSQNKEKGILRPEESAKEEKLQGKQENQETKDEKKLQETEKESEETLESKDKEETVESKDEEESVETKSEAESVSKDEEESAETKDEEESAESKDEEESVETKDEEESAETKDKEESVSKDEEESVETKDEEEPVESKDEESSLESKDEEESVETKDEEESIESKDKAES